MTARRKGKKSEKRRPSREEQKECSDYMTLEGSETSDSDRLPTPDEPPAQGACASNLLTVDESKGAVPKSRSWAQASTSQAEQPAKREKGRFQSNRTSPPRTRSQSKSPFRYGGRAFSSRPKGKSPLKGVARFLSGERNKTPIDENPLIDFQDGVERKEPKKKKEKPQDPKPDATKRVDKQDVYYFMDKERDEEFTSHSSVSETSSVEKATGALNILDEATGPKTEDSSSEDEEKGAMKESVSAHAILETKPKSPKKKDEKK